MAIIVTILVFSVIEGFVLGWKIEKLKIKLKVNDKIISFLNEDKEKIEKELEKIEKKLKEKSDLEDRIEELERKLRKI